MSVLPHVAVELQEEGQECFDLMLDKTQNGHNHNNKKAPLGPHGFTKAKWVVATKSDDSYTKREAVAVQGDQQ